MMKRTIKISFAFLLILGMLTGFTSFASQEMGQAKGLDRAALFNKVWSQYSQLEEFKIHLKENPEDARAMIEDIVDTQLKINSSSTLKSNNVITPQSGNGTISLIYFPKFKQNNSYYCGPASALTAIYGMGKEGSVKGSSYSEKQETLAKNMGTNQQDGTYVYKMRDELNKYSSEKYNYYYQPTKSDMSYIIAGSLLSDNAPILHAYTDAFGYYNGYKTGHYVTVVFYNSKFKNNEVGGLAVMDNNRNDKYYGTRDISLDEAYNSIRGRYLIGVSL